MGNLLATIWSNVGSTFELKFYYFLVKDSAAAEVLSERLMSSGEIRNMTLRVCGKCQKDRSECLSKQNVHLRTDVTISLMQLI